MSILACFCFLALLVHHASSISFNFTNINHEEHSKYINVQNDAGFSPDEGIQMTNETNPSGSSGRATYAEQLHLWDAKSGYLASFSTSFSFVIDSDMSEIFGDGLAFFLAEHNDVINYGEAMGLPFDEHNNFSRSPFVAVEFDTYGNPECDPKYPDVNATIGEHVGIDISSVISVAYKKWYTSIRYGKECNAFINYDANSKILSVSFTDFKYNSPEWETGLQYTIDLRKVLPEQVIFGFSASTGVYKEKTSVRSWAFNSTEFKGDAENNVGLAPTISPADKANQSSIILPPTTSQHVVKPNTKTGLMVGLIAGILVLVVVFGILAYCFYRRKKNNGDNMKEVGSVVQIDNELEMEAFMPRRYSYAELAKSTVDFAEKLGEGGFGGVYKGYLKDISRYVAVKRVSKSSSQRMKEYAAEVRIISRLRHRNLVQLTGWCHEKEELLVVYEYLENGSLDLHLFKGKSMLTWNTRYKIAQGLASALLYLHEGWEQCVLHRDIKSSNVMLDSNFNAKLGDFGLARLVDHENDSQTTMFAGTFGYMAPEYIMTGKASKESDVFSFGVVALEIACGRKSIHPYAQEGKMRLVEWVWDLYGTATLSEAADPHLEWDFVEEEMTCLMIVGLWCAHPDSNLRPSMKQAIQVLNSEASLPILPSKMPNVTDSTTLTSSSYGATSSSGSNTTTTIRS